MHHAWLKYREHAYILEKFLRPMLPSQEDVKPCLFLAKEMHFPPISHQQFSFLFRLSCDNTLSTPAQCVQLIKTREQNTQVVTSAVLPDEVRQTY